MSEHDGWICPICGSVYSPFTRECWRCVNAGLRTATTGGTGGKTCLNCGRWFATTEEEMAHYPCIKS